VANSHGAGTSDAASGEPSDDERSARRDRTRKILADGERRDDEAAARDVTSDERSNAADLEAFLNVDGDYAGYSERRAAAQDRRDAKGDREKSADDRVQLSED
jgi:hypothetical protein